MKEPTDKFFVLLVLFSLSAKDDPRFSLQKIQLSSV